jgi:predicted heme/steroid binding protein
LQVCSESQANWVLAQSKCEGYRRASCRLNSNSIGDFVKSLLAFLLLLIAAAAVSAQDAAPPLKLGDVTFSGSIRERYEVWNWFEPTTGNNLYGYSGTLVRFGLSQKKEHYDWNVELEVPILLGLPEHAVNPPPLGQYGLGGSYYAANDNQQNAAFIFPRQAWFRFKGAHSSLRAGRMEFTDGSEVTPKDATLASLKADRIGQRLIGNFGFSNVQRSLDGLQYAYTKDSWTFIALSAIPTRGVFQVDGTGWVKTPVTYVALTKQAEFGESKAEWRVFGIYYNDDRPIVKTDNRPAPAKAGDLGNINIGTYGGHFILAKPTSSGTFDFLFWGALQNGNWGLLTQRAAAGALEFGFQPKGKGTEKIHPWFRGGYFYATGDDNPADDTHGTFFAVLPTPRVYARFPFFNYMNNTDAFAEVMLRPSKKLTLRSDVHGLWLSSKSDLWYSGGGAFQPNTFGFNGRPSNGQTYLATLYDLSADYKWKYGLAFGLYFGYAQGGDVIKKIYAVNANGALGFTEMTYRF